MFYLKVRFFPAIIESYENKALMQFRVPMGMCFFLLSSSLLLLPLVIIKGLWVAVREGLFHSVIEHLEFPLQGHLYGLVTHSVS